MHYSLYKPIFSCHLEYMREKKQMIYENIFIISYLQHNKINLFSILLYCILNESRISFSYGRDSKEKHDMPIFFDVFTNLAYEKNKFHDKINSLLSIIKKIYIINCFKIFRFIYFY